MSNYKPTLPTTALSERMRDLAKTRDDLPENWLEIADNLDAAAAGFFGEDKKVNVSQFMSAFAKARKAWCAATGESLV